jgi:hypothetical protein
MHLKLGLAAMLVLLAAAIAVGGAGALLMAPALLAVLPLLLGRYPGEELLARLVAVRRAQRRISADARLPRAPRALGRRRAALASRGASRAPPLPA